MADIDMAEIDQELQDAVTMLNRAANPLGARLAMLQLQAKEIELQASKSSEGKSAVTLGSDINVLEETKEIEPGDET